MPAQISESNSCQHCFWWRKFIASMAKIDGDWSDWPPPPHPCKDKAKEN